MGLQEVIVNPIVCAGGTEVGFTLAAARRGSIKKLRVLQTAGALEGFSYCLYNTVAACPPGTTPTASATVNELLYRVTGLVAVDTGKAQLSDGTSIVEEGVTGLDLAFVIQDDHDGNPLARSSTNQGSRLPMKLIAAGTGAKTFAVAITYEPDKP